MQSGSPASRQLAAGWLTAGAAPFANSDLSSSSRRRPFVDISRSARCRSVPPHLSPNACSASFARSAPAGGKHTGREAERQAVSQAGIISVDWLVVAKCSSCSRQKQHRSEAAGLRLPPVTHPASPARRPSRRHPGQAPPRPRRRQLPPVRRHPLHGLPTPPRHLPATAPEIHFPTAARPGWGGMQG